MPSVGARSTKPTESAELTHLNDEWKQAAKESLEQAPEEEQPPQHTKHRELRLSTIVAQFCAIWPGAFQDGNIGWRRFWVMWNEREAVHAVHHINAIKSATIARGLANNNSTANYEYDQVIQRVLPY